MGYTKETSKQLAHIFQAFKWEWHDVGVPSAEQIAKVLKDLKKDAKKVKGFAGTGRLCARWDNEDKSVGYSLEFYK